MPAHVRTVDVPALDRRELERRVREEAVPDRVVERARIVLLASEGRPGKQIATIVGCSEPTVVTWRGRYVNHGLDGLEDLPRRGKPTQLPEALLDRVLQLTLTEPPAQFGATHWSSRRLATVLAGEGTPISHATVARVWQRFGVQPWRAQRFRFSTNPALEGGIRGVAGLYLLPPEKAIVLCVDENPPVAALEQTTLRLFEALEIASGEVSETQTARHRERDFLEFLEQVAATYPNSELHVVVDGLSPHSQPRVRAWLEHQSSIQLHAIPPSASWLNLVETLLSHITRRARYRGNFPTVGDLITTIGRSIDKDPGCTPFAWIKEPDDVVVAADRARRGPRGGQRPLRSAEDRLVRVHGRSG